MEIIQIVVIGLISVFLIIILKQYRPEFAIYVSIIAGTIILLMILDKITYVIKIIQELANKSGINSEYIQILLKITGIAYLTEFGINMCLDSNEKAIASKIELGGKIIMIYLSIPIILELLNVITKIIS